MREIKFKAWYAGNEKENGGWIQGFNMVNFHSYYNKGSEPNIYRYSKEWKLSEISLCQFTGLYDCTKWEELSEKNRSVVKKEEWNGFPIYEGDILKIRRPFRLTQTHYGNNIPQGSYTEPLEPAIKEEFLSVSFHGGCFVIGDPSLGDLLCWQLGSYDKESAIELFRSAEWEGEDGDLAYLLDNYKFDSEKELLNSLGTRVVGNIYQTPELLK